jgi:hypothetical protein
MHGALQDLQQVTQIAAEIADQVRPAADLEALALHLLELREKWTLRSARLCGSERDELSITKH